MTITLYCPCFPSQLENIRCLIMFSWGRLWFCVFRQKVHRKKNYSLHIVCTWEKRIWIRHTKVGFKWGGGRITLHLGHPEIQKAGLIGLKEVHRFHANREGRSHIGTTEFSCWIFFCDLLYCVILCFVVFCCVMLNFAGLCYVVLYWVVLCYDFTI